MVCLGSQKSLKIEFLLFKGINDYIMVAALEHYTPFSQQADKFDMAMWICGQTQTLNDIMNFVIFKI